MSTEIAQAKPAKQKSAKTGLSWGWLVVLVAAILVAGAAAGTWFFTNQIAQGRYAETLAAGGATILTVPRFGDDYAVPIISGTTLVDLREGVGHYEGSAGPGETGNFALTGHRLGWGQPFADLDKLQVGDEVRVTTPEAEYVYAIITGPTRIPKDDASILASVPGDPDASPAMGLMTLVTAADVLPSPDRLVVVAELVGVE